MGPDLDGTLPPTRQDRSGAAVAARVTAVFPLDLSWQLLLGTQPAIIGREGDAAVPPIDHRTVSRRHVGMFWNGSTHLVSDLGASYPGRLDGVPLGSQPQPLEDNAVIQLGDVFLVYERDPAIPDDKTVSRDSIPGRSSAVRELRAQLARAAADPSALLLLGETGTGKEWIAREIHRLSGRTGPLIALNCAALGSQIVESQLFGHVKGAFTGATGDQAGLFRAADGGTLFLDEVGELSLELQPKLLRALQDGQITPVGGTRATQVDVRVVAATNRDLADAIEQRAFRLDLYSRLALWEIAVPPLRERRVDILSWLVRMRAGWLETRAIKRPPLALMPDAVETLLLYPWPDNLRGIDRLVHALEAAPTSEAIAQVDLPAWLRRTAPATPAPAPENVPAPSVKRAPPGRDEFERAYAEHAGNVRALSRLFDRDRRQIYRWMAAYGLKRTDE